MRLVCGAGSWPVGRLGCHERELRIRSEWVFSQLPEYRSSDPRPMFHPKFLEPSVSVTSLTLPLCWSFWGWGKVEEGAAAMMWVLRQDSSSFPGAMVPGFYFARTAGAL